MDRTKRARSWLSVVGICLIAFAGTYLLAMAPFRAPASEEDPSEEIAESPSASGNAAAEPSEVEILPTLAPAEPPAPDSTPSVVSPVAPLPPVGTGMPAAATEPCTHELPNLFENDASSPKLTRDIKQAAAALGTGDWLGVLDHLEPWLATDAPAESLSAGLHYAAGWALHEIGEIGAAREHLEAAAWLAPDQSGVWIELARAHLSAGAPTYAYRAARRARQLAHRDHRAHYALGRALLELQRGDEALAAFEEAAEICRSDPDVWNAIGLVWLYRGEHAAARAALEMAVACLRPPAYAHNNLGVVYEQLGLYEWADREYARCLEQDPEHRTAAQSRHRVAPFMAVRPWVGRSRTR